MSQLKEKTVVTIGAALLAGVVIWAVAKKEPDAPAVPVITTEAAAPLEAGAVLAVAEAGADAAKSATQTPEPLPIEHEVTIELAVIGLFGAQRGGQGSGGEQGEGKTVERHGKKVAPSGFGFVMEWSWLKGN